MKTFLGKLHKNAYGIGGLIFALLTMVDIIFNHGKDTYDLFLISIGLQTLHYLDRKEG